MVQVLKCVQQYTCNLLYLVVNTHVITAVPWYFRLQWFGSPDSPVPTKNNPGDMLTDLDHAGDA